MRTALIFTRLVNFCWSLFQWCLLLAVVAALGVGGYLYFRLDDEIRRQVERRFADHYRDFHVHVGSARFDAERGIAINDLSISPKDTSDPSQPLLTIDEMYCAGKVRIEQLLSNNMQIDDIVVRGAKLRLVRQTDGQWNARGLLPLPHLSDQSPRITIEDASGTVEDAAAPAAKPWPLQAVNLKLTPLDASQVGPGASKGFQVEGTATGPPARELRVGGQVICDGKLDIAVKVLGLDISPALLANLPPSTTAKLAGAEFTGQADVTLQLKRLEASAPIGWSATAKVERGRLVHPTLPEPLTDVTLVGRADPMQIVIERMEGKYGQAKVVLALNRAGWAENSPLAVSAKAIGLLLDDRLPARLPESYARIWQRFRPVGVVDAEVRATFDGQKWRPVLLADCHGMSVTDAEKFAYPLQQTTGHVEYHPADKGAPDQLNLNLTGIGAGRPVKVDVALTHVTPEDPEGVTTGSGVALDAGQSWPGTHAAGYRGVRYARGEPKTPQHPVGFIEVSGTDVPIHDQLLDALPEKAKQLTRSLHAQGAIDFRFRCEWKELSQRVPELTQEIRLKDCRIKFESFPYPLQHVQGLVTAQNWRWTLHDIDARGSSDNTTIKCRGESVPTPTGNQTDLTFEARNVPLDDNLKQALSPAGQQAWNELGPQGFVNFTAHVVRLPDQVKPTIEVVLQPREQSVSVEPRMFPYRLDQVEGVGTYKDGTVVVQKLAGKHDRTMYTADSGSWQASPDGSWQIALANVNADRLAVTRELLIALPPSAQSVIDRLQPTGTFDIHNGSFNFSKTPQSDRMSAAWDVTLECQQAAIQGAVPIRGITGGIRVVGRSDGNSMFASGELALDSLHWKDMQLTNVRGPLFADATRCLLGEPACQQQNQPPRRMTADAYGGSLAANIEMLHDTNPSYKLDLHLGGANLARFANERLGGANNMNGTVSGKLVVAGTGSSPQTLRGSGELHVVDANIYQLPVLVAMLKVLRNRTPDSAAFNRVDMEFGIQGEHIHFEHLNLLGDAASLYGNGESDFNRRLDLVFYTLIGPADLPIPLWKTIAGHVSQQGLQLKVVGTLDDPKIESKALPAINDMLDQLQTELHEGAATITPSTATRGSRGAAK